MSTGIYKITCGDTFYYGQAQDLRSRKNVHMSRLQRGAHDNTHLQRAYDKYGNAAFEVVLYCETNELSRYEQWFLDQYQPLRKCANVASCAEASARGAKRSAETRAKMSASQKGRMHSAATRAKIGAASRGRKHTAATKAQMSAARCKYTYLVTRTDGTQREYKTLKQAAAAYGTSTSNISRWALAAVKPSKKFGIVSVERV